MLAPHCVVSIYINNILQYILYIKLLWLVIVKLFGLHGAPGGIKVIIRSVFNEKLYS